MPEKSAAKSLIRLARHPTRIVLLVGAEMFVGVIQSLTAISLILYTVVDIMIYFHAKETLPIQQDEHLRTTLMFAVIAIRCVKELTNVLSTLFEHIATP